jgi:hypothetical protein
MNNTNGEGLTSLWSDEKLDREKLYTVRRPLNVNSHSPPDRACGSAVLYAEINRENYSFLRRDPVNMRMIPRIMLYYVFS